MGNANPKQGGGHPDRPDSSPQNRKKSFKKVNKIPTQKNTHLTVPPFPLQTPPTNTNDDDTTMTTDKKRSTRDPAQIKKLFDKYALYSRAPSRPTRFVADLPGFPGAKIERGGTILVTKPPAKSRPFKSLQNLVSDRSPVLSSGSTSENNCGENFVVILGTHIYSSQDTSIPAKKSVATSSSSSSSSSAAVYQSSCWFSGHCEEKDGNFVETIIRETFEESAGQVALTEAHVQEALEEKRFFYSPRHKILTIIVLTDFASCHQNSDHRQSQGHGQGGYRLTEFNTAVQQLSEQNDYLPNTISSSMLEMEEYHAVKLIEFVKLVRRMWMVAVARNEFDFDETATLRKNRFDDLYHLKSVEGKTLRIQHRYASCLAVPEAEKAFNLIVKSLTMVVTTKVE